MLKVTLLNIESDLLDSALQNYFEDINCYLEYQYECELLGLTIKMNNNHTLDLNKFFDNFKHVIV